METVILRSKIGPTQYTYRPATGGDYGMQYGKFVREFTIDNSLKVTVPKQEWEHLEELDFDRTAGLKFKNCFLVIPQQ